MGSKIKVEFVSYPAVIALEDSDWTIPEDDCPIYASDPLPLATTPLVKTRADIAGHHLRAPAAQTMPSSASSVRFFPSISLC